MSRVAAVALAVAASLAVVPAADAAKQPVRCKAGFGKLTLNAKPSCVRARQLLPRVPTATNPWLPFLRWAVLQPEEHVFELKAGGKVAPLPSFGIAAPSVTAALSALKPYGDLLQLRLTGQAAPRRAPLAAGRGGRRADGPVVTLGPSTVTTAGNDVSITGTMTSRDTAAGVTSTVEIGAHSKKGKDGKIDPTANSMDITFGVATDAGKAASFTLSMPMNGKDSIADRCPSTTGVVRRDTQFSTRNTTDDVSETFVQENSEARTLSFNEKFRGFVDEDAKLERVNYEIHTRFSSTRRVRALFGIFDIVTRLRINVDASGSMNGRTGAITTGTTNVAVTFNSTELSGAEIATVVRNALADGSVRAKFEQMAADMAARGYASMKETEKHWRTPNACAKAALAPTHAILHSGSSKAIRGTVRSDGGTIAAGKWKRLRIGPGSVVSGLPGRSSRSSPASVKVRAGRPAASGATVLLKTRAVSRAGIAETTWRAEGEVPDLYYKIDDVTYSASYTGSLSGQGLPCSVLGSATENGHLAGLPFARDFDTLRATGNNYNGGLGVPPTSKAQRTAMLHGCDITAGVSPPPPCDIAPTSEVAMTVGLGVTMPDNKPATITWQFPPATVAGDSDLVSNCYVGAITATPATVTTTRADRTVFLNPGPHEVSASQPVHVHVSLSGFATSVDGTATVRFKFHRVNADGTPFTG